MFSVAALALSPPGQANVGRREAMIVGLGSLGAVLPMPAFAQRSLNQALARRFEANYADALHPLCERHISVDAQPRPSGEWTAHISGTDVGPQGIGQTVMIGCDDTNINRYQLREWSFDAKISADGERIDAGDRVHVGSWHSREQSNKDGTIWSGIRWNDGNKWSVLSQSS